MYPTPEVIWKFKSHDKLYLHIKILKFVNKTHAGKLSAIAGLPASFVNRYTKQWWGLRPGGPSCMAKMELK